MTVKRWYRGAAIDEGRLLLDGRPAKTKAGRPLAGGALALMDAIAGEWNAQGDTVDFSAMPMTRFSMTLIDLGPRDAPAWRAALVGFLKTDLLCYRAVEPALLAERQNAAWDPILDWASTRHGIALLSGKGVSFITQPEAAIAAGECAFGATAPAALLGMKAAAEIAGSAVIGLALHDGAFAPAALFNAARVDEAFQEERWGRDAEAAARADGLRRDFLDAARFLQFIRPSDHVAE